MKILLLNQYFGSSKEPGGSRWHQFVKYFNEKTNDSIDVLAGNIHYSTGKKLSQNQFFFKEKIFNKTWLYRSWTYAGYNKNFFSRLFGYLSFMISAFVRGIFLKRPDLIICTSPPLFIGVPCLLLSFFKRVPFVIEIRDLWPESAEATGVVTNQTLLKLLFSLEKILYYRASKIVVLTPAFQENIVKRFPELEKKIEIITNAADFDLIPVSSKGSEIRILNSFNNKKVFGYFGAHGLANDLNQILNIAEDLKDYPQIHFILVGDGMMKSALKEKAKKLNLKNVQFIDSVSKNEVFDWINACDVCLATLKKTDTFKTVYPNKVFDYMACSKPMIVTIDGITRDLIETSKSGLYAEPENSIEFKKAILNLFHASPLQLRQMGESGNQFVHKNFDREVLFEKYYQIIHSFDKKIK